MPAMKDYNPAIAAQISRAWPAPTVYGAVELNGSDAFAWERIRCLSCLDYFWHLSQLFNNLVAELFGADHGNPAARLGQVGG